MFKTVFLATAFDSCLRNTRKRQAPKPSQKREPQLTPCRVALPYAQRDDAMQFADDLAERRG